LSNAIAERITTATITELSNWGAFDFQMASFFFVEIDNIYNKCMNSMAIARKEKPDFRAWVARQDFMDSSKEDATKAMEELTRLNTKLNLEIEEGVVENVRSCISKMQQLSQIVIGSLNEFRLVEQELHYIVGKVI